MTIRKIIVEYEDGSKRVLGPESAIAKSLRGEYSKTISISLPREIYEKVRKLSKELYGKSTSFVKESTLACYEIYKKLKIKPEQIGSFITKTSEELDKLRHEIEIKKKEIEELKKIINELKVKNNELTKELEKLKIEKIGLEKQVEEIMYNFITYDEFLRKVEYRVYGPKLVINTLKEIMKILNLSEYRVKEVVEKLQQKGIVKIETSIIK